MQFVWNDRESSLLTLRQKSEKILEPCFVKVYKSVMFGYFWPFLAIIGQIWIFPLKRALSLHPTHKAP